MDELETHLDELEAAFKAGQQYFNSDDVRLRIGFFETGVKPTLERVVAKARTLLDRQYSLGCEDPDASLAEHVELVHYTSLASLVSILGGTRSLNNHALITASNVDENPPSEPSSTSSIRLYDTEHFNDPDEGEYLVRSLRLYEEYDWIDERDFGHAYIASFIHPDGHTNITDNLVYWRTYGDDGEGCSITVSVPKNKVRKVLYGREGVNQICGVVVPLMDKFNSIVSECELSGDIQSELSNSIWEVLHPVLYLHKSEAYDYERECRFVLSWEEKLRGEVRFEYDDSIGVSPKIRHYIERNQLNVSEILVSGSYITLGPRISHRLSARLLIERLLQSLGLHTHVQVKFSEITYGATHG